MTDILSNEFDKMDPRIIELFIIHSPLLNLPRALLYTILW
jgi:hypothetical protein